MINDLMTIAWFAWFYCVLIYASSVWAFRSL